MRIRIAAAGALVLLAAALPAPASAAAPEGCWRVTRSADAEFRKGLTAAQRSAAAAEATRRGCDTTPVPDGTPGAVNAEQALALLPQVREFFKDAKSPVVKRDRKATGQRKGGGKKAAPKATKRPTAVPRPRPTIAPSAPPPVAPAAVPDTVPALEPPSAREVVVEPAKPAHPPAVNAPAIEPPLEAAPAEPRWRQLLRRFW